jgi:heme oxygenase
MSLKDLTWDKHQAAEATDFMKSVFKKKMPIGIWADYTYNKMLWFGAIETKASAEGYLDDLPGIQRAYFLYQDAKELLNGEFPQFRQTAIDYHRYILDLPPGLVLAHLYVWHMGDLFGGQMIKKILPPPHRNLDFKDVDSLKANMRPKLDDSLGEEANIAFDWAIKIMDSYNDELGLEHTD